MKISLNPHKNTPKTNFKGIYNNKMLLKGLKFAADNSALFCATTSLALSTIARPAAILSTPKTDKKNKFTIVNNSKGNKKDRQCPVRLFE